MPGLTLTPIEEVDERQQLEALFLQNLGLLERIADLLCRRHGTSDIDRDEFTSWLKLRIIEDNYAVFKKFRGESSLSTYLNVVVAMFFRDFRVQLWGRWRPSAAAQRAGHLAIRLEMLVTRDRLPLQQASEILRTSGETTLSDAELSQLLKQLPARAPLRPAANSLEEAKGVVTSVSADAPTLEAEAREERARAYALLHAAVASESTEDQVILRMHFWDALTVAQIARALRLDQKPLYRRLQRLLSGLRRSLEERGLSGADVESLVDWDPG